MIKFLLGLFLLGLLVAFVLGIVAIWTVDYHMAESLEATALLVGFGSIIGIALIPVIDIFVREWDW